MLFGSQQAKPRGLFGMFPAGPVQRMDTLAPAPLGHEAPRAPQMPQQAGGKVNWGGVIADALAGAAGMQPMYLTSVLQKRQQDAAMQQAAAERASSMQDWRTKFDYEQANKAPPQPHYWESNDGSLMQIGADGRPQKVYQDPDPRLIPVPDGMGGMMLVPAPRYGDQPQGVPLKPVGKLTPIGDGSSNATGGFPVTSNTLDRVTIQSESAGNPNAVSPKGARGLWQVMPATARDPGFGIRPSNGTPQDDARVGQQYRQAMQKRYGNNLPKMWGAYNWGPGNVDKAVARWGDDWLAHAPAETQAYVARNMRAVRGN